MKSSGNERVDVRGLVASVQEPTNKANKMEVWIEDESNKALLVEMWGDTFVALAKRLEAGSVLQVDNAQVKRQGDVICLNAEAYQDSDKGNSFAFIDPAGERTEELRKLDVGRAYLAGEKISDVWTPSGLLGRRMTTSGASVYVSCVANLRSCSLWAETLGKINTSADALTSNGAQASAGSSSVTPPASVEVPGP